jgi:hypothetical protein
VERTNKRSVVMGPLYTWWEASGWKSRRSRLERSRATRGGRCVCSTSPPVRGWRTPSTLRRRRCWKRIGGGVERAAEVCAVQDGAEWLQGLVDYHRADAVRILDFAHAAEYVNELGQAVQAAGGRLPAGWLEGVLHRLKHQGPARVLHHLAWLAARYPSSLVQEKLLYLQKREAHMQYPTYQAAGWPIGSGSVESANKLVVEARLTGAGMRWGRQNVNPMLVLRNAVCNREWKQTWATSVVQRQTLRTKLRQAKSQQRLDHALWFLLIWAVRVYRLSHPPVAACPAPTAVESLAKPSTRRPSSGYSWHQPFLRRPPSTRAATEEVGAKK